MTVKNTMFFKILHQTATKCPLRTHPGNLFDSPLPQAPMKNCIPLILNGFEMFKYLHNTKKSIF